MSKALSKQYHPPSLTTITKLQGDFNLRFQDLFFQHLDRVIMHNTIALELENAKLQELTNQKERQNLLQREVSPSSTTTHTEILSSKKLPMQL